MKTMKTIKEEKSVMYVLKLQQVNLCWTVQYDLWYVEKYVFYNLGELSLWDNQVMGQLMEFW